MYSSAANMVKLTKLMNDEGKGTIASTSTVSNNSDNDSEYEYNNERLSLTMNDIES